MSICIQQCDFESMKSHGAALLDISWESGDVAGRSSIEGIAQR